MKTAILILAAGASTRMGRPKQLLPFGDTSLLGHVVRNALAVDCGPVFVVLGANAAAIRASIGAEEIRVLYCADWQLGMGASIRSGIAAIEAEAPGVAAVLIVLADQPRIDADIICSFLTKGEGAPEKVIAASYEGTLGVPVLFPSSYFRALCELHPAKGAKPLLDEHSGDVLPHDIGANPDVDTPEDYEAICPGRVD